MSQGGEIGRRARLRNPKSSLSRHHFSLHEKAILQEEIARFPRNRFKREAQVESSSSSIKNRLKLSAGSPRNGSTSSAFAAN
jgi:hypothetical protein